jgi:hypothetical protein
MVTRTRRVYPSCGCCCCCCWQQQPGQMPVQDEETAAATAATMLLLTVGGGRGRLALSVSMEFGVMTMNPCVCAHAARAAAAEQQGCCPWATPHQLLLDARDAPVAAATRLATVRGTAQVNEWAAATAAAAAAGQGLVLLASVSRARADARTQRGRRQHCPASGCSTRQPSCSTVTRQSPVSQRVVHPLLPALPLPLPALRRVRPPRASGARTGGSNGGFMVEGAGGGGWGAQLGRRGRSVMCGC